MANGSSSKHRRGKFGELVSADAPRVLTERLQQLPGIEMSRRCKLCGLQHREPELWKAAMTHLLAGGSLATLQRYLQDAGHELSIDSLSRCRKNHVRRWVSQILALQLSSEALAGMLEKDAPADLAVRFLQESLVFIHAVAVQLYLSTDEEGNDLAGADGRQQLLEEVTEPNFRQLMAMGRGTAKDLATAERMRAQTELDKTTLQLRVCELAAKQERHKGDVRQLLAQVAEKLSAGAKAEVAAALEELTIPELPAPGSGEAA